MTFSCFDGSTTRICSYLEHDFFRHDHTSISLWNMEVKRSVRNINNNFEKKSVKYVLQLHKLRWPLHRVSVSVGCCSFIPVAVLSIRIFVNFTVELRHFFAL